MGSRPSRAIQLKQRYTALYSIQLYIAIQYTTSTSPLWCYVNFRERTCIILAPLSPDTEHPAPLAAWLAVRRGRGGQPAAVDASDAGELAAATAAAGASTMGEHGKRAQCRPGQYRSVVLAKFAWTPQK